jgi:hypothetical protein
VIRLVHTILPITDTTIEVAQFDTQKIKYPAIQGIEYQQGNQLGFWNTREYVLFRDNHTCQYCKGKSKDKVLNVHHIESRKTGGDSPDNLITLCETCHQLIHQNGWESKIKRRSTSLRDASAMTVMRWIIYNRAKKQFPNLKITYGYITKHTRIKHGLEKSQTVDARCISGNPMAKPTDTVYLMKQVGKNNR